MLYYVCRLSDDSTKWLGLRSTHDEEYAEQLFDYYCEKYPSAYIDILDADEYHGGKDVPEVVNPYP